MTKWQKQEVVYWEILYESQHDTICRVNTLCYHDTVVQLYDELYNAQVALKEMNQ